jgi:FixJ family two-component response regulator
MPATTVPANIAVVDDESSVRRALDRLLRSAGFRVATFDSAEQFLALCHPEAVSCLVLDLQLDGMTGAELQLHLARTGAWVPTVIITAHDDPVARANAERHGAVAFLRKPFEDEDLIEAVRQAVAGRV